MNKTAGLVVANLLVVGCSDVMTHPVYDDDGSSCEADQVYDGAIDQCVASCNPSGLQHALELRSGGETRHFMLDVPASYDCATPTALLIDFHGTWSGNESDNGEEFYALAGMLAESEAHGIIVARPRSRFSIEGDSNLYRWDESPGDLDKNVAFTRLLVEHLSALYNVDPDRVYAAGFSSGTNMAAQFFADTPQLFHGYAFIGGGVFGGEAPARVDLDTTTRIYAVSGYRDYLHVNETELFTLLDAFAFPHDRIFERTDTNGHELYGWHYRELLDWLDRGERPAGGTLASGWTAEVTGADEDFTALTSDGAGSLLATGSRGGIYRRSQAGWSKLATVAGTPALSGACVLPNGAGIAVGESKVAHTIDHGATWKTDVTIPAFVDGFFPVPFMNAVGCSQTKLVSVGYWNAATSTNATTWTQASALNQGFASQGAQVKASAAGTWIASGYYDYIGRSTDGVTFTNVVAPVSVQWLMGIASAPGGHWWIAGEAGTLLASTDDGASWTDETIGIDDDLYAVGFFDDQRGLAVGTHGTAYLTIDGGAHWMDRSTGLDAFLGDVVWLDANTVLVVGGGGTAVTLHVD